MSSSIVIYHLEWVFRTTREAQRTDIFSDHNVAIVNFIWVVSEFRDWWVESSAAYIQLEPSWCPFHLYDLTGLLHWSEQTDTIRSIAAQNGFVPWYRPWLVV